MGSLRRYFRVRANSILESVIALCIISVCLSVAIMVYASVFSPSTSVHFYKKQNKVNAYFFILQVNPDSLLDNPGNNLKLESEVMGNCTDYSMEYSDSIGKATKKQYYVLPNE